MLAIDLEAEAVAASNLRVAHFVRHHGAARQMVGGECVILETRPDSTSVLQPALRPGGPHPGRNIDDGPEQMAAEIDPMDAELHYDAAGNTVCSVEPVIPVRAGRGIAYPDHVDRTKPAFAEEASQPSHLGKVAVHEADGERRCGGCRRSKDAPAFHCVERHRLSLFGGDVVASSPGEGHT